MRPSQSVNKAISLPRGPIFADTMALMRDCFWWMRVNHHIGSVPYAATQDSKISEAISHLYDAQ